MNANSEKYKKPLFNTFYISYYQELLSEALNRRWQQIDIITTFLVVATASGSTIVGLALWNTSAGKLAWGFIAAVASVASIAHGVIGVPSRVKEQEELRRMFSELRIDAETFYQQLVIGFDANKANDEFNKLKKRLSQGVGRAGSDIAATNGLRKEVQNQLEKRLTMEFQ